MFKSWKEKKEKNKLNKLDILSVPPFSFDGKLFMAKIIHVVDGDSCTAIIKFKKEYYSIKCRLWGIDTPELRTKNEREKKVANIVKEYVAHKILDKIVWIQCYHNDSFGRTLIKIYEQNPTLSHEFSLNQQLVDKNYAYAYDGKKKTTFDEWCKICDNEENDKLNK